jgi:hypothetical protein
MEIPDVPRPYPDSSCVMAEGQNEQVMHGCLTGARVLGMLAQDDRRWSGPSAHSKGPQRPEASFAHAPEKISSGAQSLGEVASAVDVAGYTILLPPGGKHHIRCRSRGHWYRGCRRVRQAVLSPQHHRGRWRERDPQARTRGEGGGG